MTARSVGYMLLAGLGYWLLGAAAGFFTIPPGYASPIWPAAGWAVICCIRFGWPALLGVFFASFYLNIQFSNASLLQPSIAWVVAGFIALGAVCQAGLASYCAKRFALSAHGDAVTVNPVKLALVIGPLASLMSPTVGISTLVSFDIVLVQSASLNWLHWWIGDAIGAMAFAPFISLMSMADHWSAPRRVLVFLGFYVLLIALVSLTFVQSRTAEEQRIENVFNEQVETAHQSILKQLQAITFAGRSIASLFETFPAVEYTQFNHYAQGVYEYIPGSQGISWVPIVADASRNTFEQAMAQALGERFEFKERYQGSMVPASTRERYYPVYYIFPFEPNRRAAGFDLGSNSERLIAIQQLISSRAEVITAPITLVQETGNQRAFLLFTPIESSNKVSSFVSSVYRAEDLLLAGVPESVIDTVGIVITDVTANDDTQALYGGETGKVIYEVVRSVDFGQRTWQIRYSIGENYVAQHQTPTVWFVLIIGFMVVIVFGLFILQILNSHSLIKHEVRVKTLALEEALQIAKDANSVKTNFLACMSHELRTPLNSIIGFSVRCLKILSPSHDQKLITAITVIERNGQHLLDLINNVLDLAKVEAGKMTITKASIDIAATMDEVVTTLQPLVDDKPIEIKVKTPPLNTILADQQRFKQIFINLGANAINFTREGRVQIDYALETTKGKQALRINVRDTGIGIAKEHVAKVFQRFEQVGEQFQPGSLGSGLGLALVHEFVTLHGGRIKVTSEVGRGSVFSVWLPIDTEAER
ncbi:CHASE domain-containing protein [Saccharophagus degradans]|uniref:CHASE domain-containing protein n=1 Tax=Saccharophagus degradans TaxID=86304 RepID=UPI002477D265|nr:CHASE domain-containing protein [Saccharophagus degradans]WGO99180.1 CHASE domain-containing protein [Saccharophagus degradans]